MSYEPAGSPVDAERLQGRFVSYNPPDDGDELTWDDALNQWLPKPEESTGGGTPAGGDGDIQTNDSGDFGALTPGTNVATALGVAVGTDGAFVVKGGALGEPTSGNINSGLIASGAVTLAKMADVTGPAVLGRKTSDGTGPPLSLPLGTGVLTAMSNAPDAASGILTYSGIIGTSGTKVGLLNANVTMTGTKTLDSSGVLDLAAASVTAGLKLPSSAGASPTADSFLAFDTTNHWPVWGSNGSTRKAASQAGAEALTNKSVNGATISIADPIRVYTSAPLTVQTTGSAADLGTITVPSAIGRWTTAGTASTTSIVLVVAETAAGSLGSGQFIIRDASGGGGNAVTATFGGPSAAGGIVSSGGALVNETAPNTLYVRQTTNSANAGTISVYLTIYPIP